MREGSCPDAVPCILSETLSASVFWTVPVAGGFLRATNAALTTWIYGGLIPQARHAGRGVRAFAVVGSKFGGMSFENEQIGQIHVPVTVVVGAGEEVRDRKGLPCEDAGVAGVVFRPASEVRFVTFGYRVIFAEDFRKPACNY